MALTCKDYPLVWTLDCKAAFEQLKAELVGPEVMAFPNGAHQFVPDTDACDEGIGAVLSQLQDGREQVIAYAS